MLYGGLKTFSILRLCQCTVRALIWALAHSGISEGANIEWICCNVADHILHNVNKVQTLKFKQIISDKNQSKLFNFSSSFTSSRLSNFPQKLLISVGAGVANLTVCLPRLDQQLISGVTGNNRFKIIVRVVNGNHWSESEINQKIFVSQLCVRRCRCFLCEVYKEGWYKKIWADNLVCNVSWKRNNS